MERIIIKTPEWVDDIITNGFNIIIKSEKLKEIKEIVKNKMEEKEKQRKEINKLHFNRRN